MADLIDRARIYAIVKRLEDEALELCNRFATNENREEFLKWCVILAERSASEQEVEHAPSVDCEQQWIPVTERLPEEDIEVLISYRYKEGEGDTSHTAIDITTYGQMYFGGNTVGNYKHWRAPFEYFASNYEVVAWMPLPVPYREEDSDE